MVERPLTRHDQVTLRHPTEADQSRLAGLVREWWDERPPRFERLWIRHFCGTSAVAEDERGHLVAVAIAFASRALPGRGVLHLVAVAPSHRRHGLGRGVAETAMAALGEDGIEQFEATVWPGNRGGVRFLEALGFAPVDASRATPLFGVPALADYDGDGEDRALFVLSVPPAA